MELGTKIKIPPILSDFNKGHMNTHDIYIYNTMANIPQILASYRYTLTRVPSSPACFRRFPPDSPEKVMEVTLQKIETTTYR